MVCSAPNPPLVFKATTNPKTRTLGLHPGNPNPRETLGFLAETLRIGLHCVEALAEVSIRLSVSAGFEISVTIAVGVRVRVSVRARARVRVSRVRVSRVSRARVMIWLRNQIQLQREGRSMRVIKGALCKGAQYEGGEGQHSPQVYPSYSPKRIADDKPAQQPCAALYWGCTATRRGACWITKGVAAKATQQRWATATNALMGFAMRSAGARPQSTPRDQEPQSPRATEPQSHRAPNISHAHAQHLHADANATSKRSRTRRYNAMLCQQTRWRHKKRCRRKELSPNEKKQHPTRATLVRRTRRRKRRGTGSR